MIAFLLTVALLQDQPAEKTPAQIQEEQAKELKDAWLKIIDLCKNGKKDDVQQTIAAMELTRDEMTSLFGAEKAQRVYPTFAESWKKVLAEAAADLVERQKKSGWDDVDVICINTTPDKELSADDRGVRDALAAGQNAFNVRLKQQNGKAGLLIRCFVKTKTGWKMGLRIGRWLVEK